MQETEKLITFGDLLRIKREQKKMTLREAEKAMSGLTMLSKYEKNWCMPGKKNLLKLMSFYKITEDEFKSCKEKEKNKIHSFIKTTETIENVMSHINKIHAKVSDIEEKGILASSMKKDALANLTQAGILLEDILIIDRLL